MWKYKGKAFIDGIPARDITDEEFEKLSKTDQDAVRSSGLYESDKKKPSAKSTQEE